MDALLGPELLVAALTGVATGAGLGLTALWRVSQWHARVDARLDGIEASINSMANKANERTKRLHQDLVEQRADIEAARREIAVLDAVLSRGSA